MAFPSPLCPLLGIDFPLIQAPMAGGATTPALVAAISQAGALGSLAAALLSPEAIGPQCAAIRALTARPFAVNLFVLDAPRVDEAAIALALEALAPLHAELGIAPPESPARWCQPFAEQLDALIAARPAVASFTFGMLDKDQIERLHAAGVTVIGTATHLAEGEAWVAAGADAVCAQGAEAGGHRGTFIGDERDALIGTLPLVSQLAASLPVPVIAAGGLMDGRDIAACLALGAAGAQLGTAFLRCPESGVSALWKTKLAEAGDTATRLTRAFSGRYARGLSNAYMERLAGLEARLPAYPVMNALTGPMRAAAAEQGRADLLSLWAGQGAAKSRALPAAELVATLKAETLKTGEAK
ncbi:NAD(P)H-dependent flavin oxidoreductase [Crenobacter cavernae]|uniref:Propionate 3-nitronate monooxygenase n=1 Tax=Crenobacter cavernae TaxID=2290923 RepID=A0ABY0FIM0_9NEIS|nr:nitronate monooxygenase [Crenobacter cavernae]RXZ45322.1 nitronate monooxygenase [Crenobacter cavernae]